MPCRHFRNHKCGCKSYLFSLYSTVAVMAQRVLQASWSACVLRWKRVIRRPCYSLFSRLYMCLSVITIRWEWEEVTLFIFSEVLVFKVLVMFLFCVIYFCVCVCVAACCWCCVERWASEPLGVADESPRYVLSGGLTSGQWHTRICLAHRRSSWSSYRKSQFATGDSFILTLQKGCMTFVKEFF